MLAVHAPLTRATAAGAPRFRARIRRPAKPSGALTGAVTAAPAARSVRGPRRSAPDRTGQVLELLAWSLLVLVATMTLIVHWQLSGLSSDMAMLERAQRRVLDLVSAPLRT